MTFASTALTQVIDPECVSQGKLAYSLAQLRDKGQSEKNVEKVIQENVDPHERADAYIIMSSVFLAGASLTPDELKRAVFDSCQRKADR